MGNEPHAVAVAGEHGAFKMPWPREGRKGVKSGDGSNIARRDTMRIVTTSRCTYHLDVGTGWPYFVAVHAVAQTQAFVASAKAVGMKRGRGRSGG